MALLDRFERFLDQVIPPPDEVAALVRRGEALLAAGDPDGALRLADTGLAVAPAYLRALILKADALAATARPYDALALLDAAGKDRALPAGVLGRMVELAALVGDEWRALDLEAHARARLRGADRAVAQRLLAGARALLARGAVTAGLRLARGATLADPGLGAAWLLLGRDALGRGDHALARRALDKGTAALDPADPEANRLAGEVAWGLGDLATAARCLRRAWIVGDEGAIAPLVAVLAAGDDAEPGGAPGASEALRRVLADAEGELGQVARALVGLSRGEAGAEALAEIAGDKVPDALWGYGLDVTLARAPEVASRWAREAPSRPGAAAVLALAEATAALKAGGVAAARAPIGRALEDPTTREAARALLRRSYEAAWAGRLGTLLEELASVVRASAASLGGGETLEQALRARRRELDEPLRVVLLGEFSAGKSTFLNALVGVEVSPMGVLPTTAQVHWLRQGDRGARVVDVRGQVVESSIEDAPRVVARRRASGDVVDYVEVTMPIPRLGRMEVIDTPGFNAGDPDHEDAVRRAFELADVAIWLFDTRQAGKESEVSPLAEARARGLPVVGVLNKIDRAQPAERATVLALVREGFGALAPCVMAVSARQALRAAQHLESPSEELRAGAQAELEASGWVDLVRYLDEQLIARRIAWKQARVASRSKVLVDEAWEAVVGAVERDRRRRDEYGALSDAIAALREAVWATGAVVRREVAAVLRDQLRGLRDDRAQDLDALVADAVAEIGYRVRGRALAALAERMREVERLGVAVGLVEADAAAVLTSPVVQYLDGLVAEGVRDAAAPAVPAGANAGPSFVMSDPLAALDATVDRSERGGAAPTDALQIALEMARAELARFATPALPLPALPLPALPPAPGEGV